MSVKYTLRIKDCRKGARGDWKTLDQLVEETGLTEIDICEALNDLFQLGILEKQVKKTKKGVVALLMLKQPVAMSLKRIVK